MPFYAGDPNRFPTAWQTDPSQGTNNFHLKHFLFCFYKTKLLSYSFVIRDKHPACRSRVAEPVHPAAADSDRADDAGLPGQPHGVRHVAALPGQHHVHRPKRRHDIRRHQQHLLPDWCTIGPGAKTTLQPRGLHPCTLPACPALHRGVPTTVRTASPHTRRHNRQRLPTCLRRFLPNLRTHIGRTSLHRQPTKLWTHRVQRWSYRRVSEYWERHCRH